MQRQVREDSGEPSSYFTIVGGRKDRGLSTMTDLKLGSEAERAFIELNDICLAASRISTRDIAALRKELPTEHWLFPVVLAFVSFRLTLAQFDEKRGEHNA